MARTARTIWQSIVSPVLSTSLYFVVFGAAIGSRISQIDGVSYGAFIVPGLIMLMLLTQSTMQRLVRHLFPALHRHDLRDPVGAGVVVRDRARLCRGGGDQVDRPRADHPGHLVAVRAAAHRASVLDAGLPGADGGHLQPVRLHHRHLGRRFREAADRAAADHHAADVPRRHLLFDPRAAAALAEDHLVQSGGLSDQRLPLELLRDLRRQPGGQLRHDAGVHGACAWPSSGGFSRPATG